MVKPTPKQKLKTQRPKVPAGIQGLDEISGGGLPRGRPTLVCGSAGCGKTLLAMEFPVRGATQFGEAQEVQLAQERRDMGQSRKEDATANKQKGGQK